MNKLLLEVICPSTGIVKLAKEISLKEGNPDLFADIDSIILLSTKFGALDLKFTVAASGLCSGDTVLLI